ncbi:hypothetical protein LNI90_11730 [Tenacibaculum dicentrarchi]|nr:hypothetical protein [Tenacibaculum dicentrarchi]MCD8421231.1 hypothetical protein [Tenacibaculum dicentrarchi]MCD8438356.1 hypothetical protein [Tenacibaculum dicentrarchi]MCD8452753.1 hypothetical protein [Tenacibaculum dicentrarchi]
MNKEQDLIEKNKALHIGVVIQRSYRWLFFLGITGLFSELIFMIISLIMYGNQKQGDYATYWFSISIGLILLSVFIAAFYHFKDSVKPLIKDVTDWLSVV